MKNFGIIGVGGYIAPRHLKAIKETNNLLSAAFDLNDSVGIIDQYFPNARFFLDEINFGKFIAESSNKVDYIAICSPNHFHNSNIKLSLENGCNAICEKPIVLTEKELDELSRIEEMTGKKVYTILQLRKHEMLSAFKQKLSREGISKKKEVILTYITGRGDWYHKSWKGNPLKSGGIATNIGIHLFDLLIWLFGNVCNYEVHLSDSNRISGFIELDNAYVKWFLSIDFNDIPKQIENNKRTYRSILIDNNELEFSEGFTELHTEVYKDIFEGKGIGIETARPSIRLVNKISLQPVVSSGDNLHPLTKKLINR